MSENSFNEDTVKKDGRILYVEPNDVFDKDNNGQQGYSLTPKYEDMCISFNLIIEQFSRFKKDVYKTGEIPHGDSKTWSIQWGVSGEDMIKKRTSVLQGEQVNDKQNYLTTFYTELDFDSYSEKTQIEGLCVESVNISYESWYTPTVTIKFVDIRGSSVFGREEAIHVNENLIADNIFGAFFTIPYPLFRLQVKGFFGKPVTYQLTCSKFNGSFNANTGNFEAVVTFIGYSWSLLTDIPFAYLVAAPFSTFIGNEYWERKKNSKEWGLWNDGNNTLPPPKLYDLFEKIKEARDSDTLGSATEEQSEKLKQLSNDKVESSELVNIYDSFVEGIEEPFKENYFIVNDEESGNTQLILFSDSKNFQITENIKNKYNGLKSKINESKNKLNTAIEINDDVSPNKWGDNIPNLIDFIELFEINDVVVLKDNKELSSFNVLTDIVLNEKGGKLTNESAKKIYNWIKGGKKNILKKYVYLIDLYNLRNIALKKIINTDNEINSIRHDIENNVNTNIISILGGENNGGFKPFIGNIFKIIFCHLETFCHIMFDSAKIIYDETKEGKRNYAYLGIDIKNTDLKEGTNADVIPWAAFYNKGSVGKECGYIQDISNVYGWVGDVGNHKFIEEKVVYGLQEGVQLVLEQQEKMKPQPNTLSGFPITASDFTSNESVFGKASVNSVAELATTLAIRAFNVLGINYIGQNVNYINLLGKLDAYNLYNSVKGSLTFSLIARNLTTDLLYGIMTKNEKNIPNISSYLRTKEGDETKYFYPYDFTNDGNLLLHVNNENTKVQFFLFNNKKNNISIVPSKLLQIKSYSGISDKKIFEVVGESDEYKGFLVEGKYDISTSYDNKKVFHLRDYCYNFYTKDLSLDVNFDGSYVLCDSMYKIYTKQDEVNVFKTKFESLNSVPIKINDYDVTDDISLYKKNIYHVENNHYVKFFRGVQGMLSPKINEILSNTDGLWLDKSKVQERVNLKSAVPFSLYDYWKDKNGVVLDEEGFKRNGNNKTIDELTIQQSKIVQYNDEGNLFGSQFYYMQNNIKDSFKRNCVKALLFLYTFKYNHFETKLKGFTKYKSSSVEEIPLMLLYFIGGNIWRASLSKDPIIYSNKSNGGFYVTPPKNNRTLLFSKHSNYYLFEVGDKCNYAYTINDIAGTTTDRIVSDALIMKFFEFVNDVFPTFMNEFELKPLSNDSDIKDEILRKLNYFTDKSFNDKLKKMLSSVNGVLFNYAKFINEKFVSNWEGVYNIMNVIKDNKKVAISPLSMLYNENNSVVNILKSCYNDRAIIVSRSFQYYDDITIKNDFLKTYLDGFVTGCNNILSKEDKTIGVNNDIQVSKSVYANKDLSIGIYYYLKNLWDKWLVISPSDAFDVNNFFKNKFVFTDSFYRNTFSKIAINCDKLITTWQNGAENSSMFNFMSKLLTEHGCIFLPVPDWVGFNGDGGVGDIETMENLFRPLPYSEVGPVSNDNTFVIMYTHSPSHVKTEANAYRTDSYDLWSYTSKQFTNEAKELFIQSTNNSAFDRENMQVTREGYNVPSFGVSFARQNNHIFKDIKLSMENPVMTEQSIKAQYQIALKGSSSSHSINFIGQDTFNVFSNYSYSATVEMLGNAQIAPLMYFQLNNIPMWRGTYMIYKVVHNLSVGNMTTTITGMKLNKYAQPFNTSFFSLSPTSDKHTNEDC